MLIKRKPILFLSGNTGAHYFSSDGVQFSSFLDETCVDEFNDDESCTWALVNSDIDHQPPPIPLFAAFGIFIIQLATRNISFGSNRRGVGLVHAALDQKRNHSSVSGLLYSLNFAIVKADRRLTLVPALSQMPRDKLEASVDKAIAKWGWAPRDIATALTEEKQLENDLTQSKGFQRLKVQC